MAVSPVRHRRSIAVAAFLRLSPTLCGVGRLRTFISVLVAVSALSAVVVAARGTEPVPPYIETKPDPMAGTPGTDRPGFIRANAGCESHRKDSFGEVALDLSTEVAVDGLDAPTVLEFFDTDRAFIGQREGLILSWNLTTGETEPVIDLTDVTGTENDQGVLGMAVTPDGEYLLIHFTTENESKIVAQPLSDGVPTVTGRVEVLTVEQPTTQHNGGTIAFDADGYLWATFGDGGGQGDKFGNAQDASTPLGSMVRLQVDPGDLSVVGAPGNPFQDGESGHPWVFATGIRNPFRFWIDPVTGEVWIADVGQACVEEISVLDPSTDAGDNLGWPVYEGDRPFLGKLEGAHHGPVFSYWRDGGYCVVVGGEVYRGSGIEDLQGRYVFTDFCRSEILVFDRASGTASTTGVRVEQPLDIESSPSGELYVVSMAGEVVRLVPRR